MVWGTVWGGWCGQSLPAWHTMGLGVSEMGGSTGSMQPLNFVCPVCSGKR